MDSARSPRFYTGPAHWKVAPAREDLEAEDFTVVEWPQLRKRWVMPARKMDMHRPSLLSVAHEWLAWLTEVDKLALVDVGLDDTDAVADLLGFVVEPAARLGIELAIGSETELERLDPAQFLEPYFGYPYAFERLRWCLLGGRAVAAATPRLLEETGFIPDVTQERAVRAGGGVVQIIAPAGSGKTAVLVERVRELLRRGARAEAIVCLTFNTAAANELQERLAAAGAGKVKARTFHSLGLQILRAANALPRNTEPWSPSLGQWRRLAFLAKSAVGEDGHWLDPPEAQSAISDIKLGRMMTAQQYTKTLDERSDARERTVAALYSAYEESQRENGRRIDFDDMILRAVQRLREDSSVRGRWQSAYQYVLVDEYQDIEPAQELLVRLVAAPHDQLFCVGDEDQTLYAFRRASVERIILLDKLYPALERVALGVNYRCPPAVVEASRTLIEHNKVRFSKQITAGQPDSHGSPILARGLNRPESAVVAAQTLKDRVRGEIVVLARTTDALRPVALACADMGVKIDGPQKLFEPKGARKALEDHLRLALTPHEADEKLLRSVCQTPGRSVSLEDRVSIGGWLQAGEPFDAAFASIDAPKRAGGKLLAPGELFTKLAQCQDAGTAVAMLRGPGGLDEWFENEDGMGGLDQFECEALEQAEQNAKGMSPRDYLRELEDQARRLRACRDSKEGIELSTIHGAKGRQWPHVIVVACEEKMLPHKRSLEGVSDEDRARGEGIEAERRLSYVAFTRAQERLEIHYDAEHPSVFLYESGIIKPPAKSSRSPRKPPPVPGLSPAPAVSLRAMMKQLLRG